MLQNRVSPFGEIIVTPARGSLMGNRGVIHNDKKEITHAFKHKAWISCVLEFKGRHRMVMMPNRWTELFFLDEATAFAAGHRPCFECRKDDAKRFKLSWLKGNPEQNFSLKTSIKNIDEIIHAERIDRNRNKVTHDRRLSELPEGAFVLYRKEPYLVNKSSLFRWTPFGYEPGISLPIESTLPVLTPNSIVNAFLAGYVPQIFLDISSQS